jgi:hypothetical protein
MVEVVCAADAEATFVALAVLQRGTMAVQRVGAVVAPLSALLLDVH